MRRLMKEAQDVQENPLPGISLAPSEDNLAEWHANVVVSGGDYDGLVMHILMDCPHDYPNSPPKAYFVNPVSYQSGATQVRSQRCFIVKRYCATSRVSAACGGQGSQRVFGLVW